jgi:hypothetical protein
VSEKKETISCNLAIKTKHYFICMLSENFYTYTQGEGERERDTKGETVFLVCIYICISRKNKYIYIFILRQGFAM